MVPLRSPIKPELFIELKGMIPPSVNHYKKPRNRDRFLKGFYVTPQAQNFMTAVALLSKGSVDAETYRLEAHIYLGKKQKGDGDNFWKVIADSLVHAGIISSDAKVTQWYLEKHRDRENPRTTIKVTHAE